jgi:predicted  nucleic acid-binding Zn-ribbon protein
MEAATPLRKPHVRTVGDRVVVDGLVVDDDSAVRLVREREEAGGDPVRAVSDAIEIGARVLDREQAGANAEFVKGELDKATREVELVLAERTREVTEQIGLKVDEAFGAESGHVTKTIEKHFSDDSTAAVQNRVREVVAEALTNVQQTLVQQFSSADSRNPLAEFKAGVVREVQDAGRRQHQTLEDLGRRMGALQQQLGELRVERDKLAEIEAERERGTAKGRTFEELVVEAVDRIAAVQGDDCDAVGDLKGATGRTGDVVVGLDACNGPARGRIVFEAKTGKLSKPDALRELDKALQQRDADFAVLVVPSEEKVPAKMRQLREYNGDKLIVTFDPEGEGTVALELAYSLARARVLMSRADSDGIDASTVRYTVERALNAMEQVRRVKSSLTGAKTSIDNANSILEDMAAQVREHLRDIDRLVAEGMADDGDEGARPEPHPEPAQESLV